MENTSDRRQAIPPFFHSVESLRQHFSPTISSEMFDEIFHQEKTVFMIRRDTSLADTRAQFLTRLRHALEDVTQTRESPELPHLIGEGESFLPRLR